MRHGDHARRCPSRTRTRRPSARRARGAPLPRRCPARAACRRARPSSPKCADHLVRAPRRPSRRRRPARAGRRGSARRCAPDSAPPLEHRAHLRFEEAAFGDELHVVEQHAFLVDVRRVGRHRARRDAADVGVMAARGDEELGLSMPIRDRRSRSRNTGAITVTSGRCVPPLYGAFSTNTSPRRMRARAPVDDGRDALAHRAQVHRHVRRVGDEVAARRRRARTRSRAAP